MSGEPEPVGGPDKLGAALRGLQFMWLGLLLGGVAITAGAAAYVVTQGPVEPDLDEVAGASIVLVGFVTVLTAIPVSFVLPSMLSTGGIPRGAVESVPGFGGYMGQFFFRAGLLEGAASVCVVLLVLSGSWWLLAGIALSLATLAATGPTRARAEAFIASARRQTAL